MIHTLRVSLIIGLFAAVSSPAIAGRAKTLYQADGWRIAIDHDGFSGDTRCSLASANGRIRYTPHALAFLLGKRRDTLRAWYRIDGGDSVRWQDRTPWLIAHDVPIDGTGLDNPTGGAVWIPLDEVTSARQIAIEPDRQTRVRTFVLRGFQPMLDAARRLGCSSDAHFAI